MKKKITTLKEFASAGGKASAKSKTKKQRIETARMGGLAAAKNRKEKTLK